MKEFTVSSREAGQRMDKYLFKILDCAPCSFVYKMLRKKNITLNEKKASGKEILRVQDCIKIFLADDTFEKFASAVPEGRSKTECFGSGGGAGAPAGDSKPASVAAGGDIAEEGDHADSDRENAARAARIEVVYEDEDILVINKPAGLLSQKAKAQDDSANDRIIRYLTESGQITREELRTFHPSVCNRLDRNTSGLLIAGKTMHGLQKMAAQLKSRSVKKYYHALVWGNVVQPQYLCGFLVKDHKTNRVRLISENVNIGEAERIETSFTPLAHFGNSTLLEVHLITGKSHQIRAHLASVGHPLLGDPKYGDAALNRRLSRETGIKRQLLHACRIEFADGNIIRADEPEDFEKTERWMLSL
ncbi:MAG: RluA family pseudouridine synthase [Clostridiales bacterium]|nr:RluA family pseudouridine synthase [Clostridiales bacterium]